MTSEPDHSNLSALSAKLAAARQQLESSNAVGEVPRTASYGMRVGMDLVSGVAVGTGIGYALDRWLGLLPLFTLICMCIGLAAGVKLMMQTARKASQAVEDEERQQTRDEQSR